MTWVLSIVNHKECSHPTEKGFDRLFCRRGSQQCTGAGDSEHQRQCASLRPSFPPPKWMGLFSLLPTPQLAWGIPKEVLIGMLQCTLGDFTEQKNRLGFCTAVAYMYFKQRCLGRFGAAWTFSQHKTPVWFQIHAGIYCEP